MRTLGGLTAALSVALLVGAVLASAQARKPAKAPSPLVQAKALAKADNSFGLDLFKQLHKPGKNTFMSPTSIAMAMRMARQGAAGDTRDEMDRVMHLTGLDAAAANKALLGEFGKRKGITLNVANSIWADPARITIKDSYSNDVQTYFDSEARIADFADSSTTGAINGWVSEKTNGLIKDVIERIPADMLTILINAIYFKGDWANKFDKAETKEADWHKADGSTKKLDLMSRTAAISYAVVDGVQVAKLPYGLDKQTAMWVALPNDTAALDELVKGLSNEQLTKWRASAHPCDGTLKLPRFTMRYNTSLVPAMNQLGMNQAFDMERADFTAMGHSDIGPIFIGMVLHEAVIIVNEEGTEAAAVTVVGCCGGGGGGAPRPFNMVCNRPFLVLITDEPTGAVLFMGTVYDPQKPDK